VRKHKFTSKVCDGRFSCEIFNINPAGVDEDFLTDSKNFKIYIGQFDNEHENFSVVCKEDSIQIFKFKAPVSGNQWDIIDTKTLSLSDLIKKKIRRNEPLFEFK
jgi:hypothetical protein